MLKKKTSVQIDESRVDAIFAQLNHCHLPGAAIGIAVDGRPVYRKAFGVANAELPVVLSPRMKIRIGSITKHFASLAYLLLCEKGRADLDDLIGKYLPEVNPASRSVTVRQLMSHMSGIRDVSDICWQFSGTGNRVTSSELLSLYRTIDDVNAAPGTRWIYNNGGYQMLSTAIERITDQSLEDVLQESIFRPVGMYDTALRRFDTDFVPNSATLHAQRSDKTFEKAHLGSALVGEGGVASTIDDMLLWLRHMDSPEIGSPNTWSALKCAQTLANGTSTGYGLGLASGLYRGLETISHSGSVLAGTSDMLKVGSAGLDVVVLTNRGDVMASSLSREVLDTCLEFNRSKEKVGHPGVTGMFRSETTGRIIQLVVREGQQIASIDGTDFPVSADSNGVLRLSPIFTLKYTITLVGGSHAPSHILFEDFGNRDKLVAVHTSEGASAQFIEGRYRSDNTDTEVDIRPSEDGATMTSVGHFGSVKHRLNCLTDNVWRSSSAGSVPWAGVLAFDRDSQAFRFTNLRTQALYFRRVH